MSTSSHGVEIFHTETKKTTSHNRVRKAHDERLSDRDLEVQQPLTLCDDESDDCDERTQASAPINEQMSQEETNTRNKIPCAEVRNAVRDGMEFINRDSADQQADQNVWRPATQSQTSRPASDGLSHNFTQYDWFESQHDANLHVPVQSTAEERSEAFELERQNWLKQNTYEIVSKLSIPKEANVIGSHTDYRRKDNGMLKARIVPWGTETLKKTTCGANLHV